MRVEFWVERAANVIGKKNSLINVQAYSSRSNMVKNAFPFSFVSSPCSAEKGTFGLRISPSSDNTELMRLRKRCTKRFTRLLNALCARP
jgi:hypothetical protein